jgi:hypothetical protein
VRGGAGRSAHLSIHPFQRPAIPQGFSIKETIMSDINPNSTSSINTVGDWAEKERRHTALAEAIRPANKAALFEALARSGVTMVLVHFDGYGDSGQIESIEARIGENPVDLPDAQVEITKACWGHSEIEQSTISIRDAIEHLAYDFLEEMHDGWENNEGAYGEFTFDVAKRAITLDYNERISEAVYSQHVF